MSTVNQHAVPDWARDLKTPTTEPPEGLPVASDAERIANARARHMAGFKKRNDPRAQYGFAYGPEHYKDYFGPESSHYAVQHLTFIAEVIGTLINGKELPSYKMRSDYNPSNGLFEALGFDLSQLRLAYEARVAELGLSEVLIEEFFSGSAGAHPDWRNLSFDQRMDIFRLQESGK